jgi:hypothetical protein
MENQQEDVAYSVGVLFDSTIGRGDIYPSPTGIRSGDRIDTRVMIHFVNWPLDLDRGFRQTPDMTGFREMGSTSLRQNWIQLLRWQRFQVREDRAQGRFRYSDLKESRL